jgi:hypothetical protein
MHVRQICIQQPLTRTDCLDLLAITLVKQEPNRDVVERLAGGELRTGKTYALRRRPAHGAETDQQLPGGNRGSEVNDWIRASIKAQELSGPLEGRDRRQAIFAPLRSAPDFSSCSSTTALIDSWTTPDPSDSMYRQAEYEAARDSYFESHSFLTARCSGRTGQIPGRGRMWVAIPMRQGFAVSLARKQR